MAKQEADVQLGEILDTLEDVPDRLRISYPARLLPWISADKTVCLA